MLAQVQIDKAVDWWLNAIINPKFYGKNLHARHITDMQASTFARIFTQQLAKFKGTKLHSTTKPFSELALAMQTAHITEDHCPCNVTMTFKYDRHSVAVSYEHHKEHEL